MRYHVLSAENYRHMPWKNGRGTTCEIGREPTGDTAPFAWRVSIADIKENGPFSPFPGYKRIINTLEGAGMRLKVDGVWTEPLLKYAPFVFSGDSQVESALLDGPIRDFNLIFNPDRVRARLQWLAVDHPQIFCSQAARILIFSVQALLATTTAFTAPLTAGSTLDVENPGHALTTFHLTAEYPDAENYCCLLEIEPLV